MKLHYLLLPIVCLLAFFAGTANGVFFKLPKLPAPHDYGDILMNRNLSNGEAKPVFFSHWQHRIKYSCRVCHFELDFAFSKGGTDITEQDNINGLFCGACHDGAIAFGHTKEHCDKCHTGKIISQKKAFQKFAGQFEETKYGNKIDWVKAIDSGKIKPAYSIYNEEEEPLGFNKKLNLQADWAMVPPAVFDHKIHVQWLDCANCHPDIFNVKKKTTKHFEMKYILEKKFCGACHLKIALPLDDCKTCHPGMKGNY